MRDFRVNEIFYSLQGEGHNTGRAAVFVRFAGCNLRCPFCDTDFSDYREMSADDIIREISAFPARFVVLTGGEPSLQVTAQFVDQLHEAGFEVAIETNGTRPVPENIDWVTVSPKEKTHPRPPYEGGSNVSLGGWQRQPDEIKVIFDGVCNPDDFLPPRHNNDSPLLYLQPCDVGDPLKNNAIVEACVEYIKLHPQWRLSLQTHKLVGFK